MTEFNGVRRRISITVGKSSSVYTFLLTLQEVILIPKEAESSPVLVLMLLCAKQM